MPPRVVVVAGEANGSLTPGPVAEGLREAGRALDVRVADVEWVSLPQDPPQVLLVELGPLGPSSLRRLDAPLDPGLDLLLWTLPDNGRVALSSQYLLGMWAWSLGAERVRCLVRDSRDLPGLEESVRNGLALAGSGPACEVIEHGAHGGGEALYQQILQSLLSAPPRRANAAQA